MENYDMILKNLLEYNMDELFYREYYYARMSPDRHNMEAFLSRHSEAEVNYRHLICPEIFGKTLASIENVYLDEQDNAKDLKFITLYQGKTSIGALKTDHNVDIQKHNRYTPGFFHSHEYFEAFYVLTGSCTHYINNKKEILKKGTLCFISPDIQHKIEVFDDSIIMNIMIQKGTFDDIFFNIIRSQTILAQFFLNSLTSKHNITHMVFHVDDEELEHMLLSTYLE